MLSSKPRLRAAAVTAAAVLAVGAPTAYAALGTGGDTAPDPRAAATRGKSYIGTHLFFGTGRPDGKPAVTDRQFMDFVSQRVTPRFPDGLTVQDARGQWRGRNGAVVRERSYQLTVLYPKSEARVRDRDIEAIRTAYKRAFAQESVLRADDMESVDF
ncbi:DUF3574 domain-containing protein [Streptomyces orinoci]|uniref:DUF3574 domain-containing protein n=1 Tax=Streptomyces orinoci TaxID=67339 RepID=A0ABV3K5B5_STRON|nr:DUF3574 domain-containing protein [Streptomyces orinoci]